MRPLGATTIYRDIPAYEKFDFMFIFFCDFDGHVFMYEIPCFGFSFTGTLQNFRDQFFGKQFTLKDLGGDLVDLVALN